MYPIFNMKRDKKRPLESEGRMDRIVIKASDSGRKSRKVDAQSNMPSKLSRARRTTNKIVSETAFAQDNALSTALTSQSRKRARAEVEAIDVDEFVPPTEHGDVRLADARHPGTPNSFAALTEDDVVPDSEDEGPVDDGDIVPTSDSGERDVLAPETPRPARIYAPKRARFDDEIVPATDFDDSEDDAPSSPPIASKRAKRVQGYVSDSDSDLDVPRISRLSKGKGKARAASSDEEVADEVVDYATDEDDVYNADIAAAIAASTRNSRRAVDANGASGSSALAEGTLINSDDEDLCLQEALFAMSSTSWEEVSEYGSESSELSECDGDPDKPFQDDEKERKRLEHNTKRRTARNTPGTSAYELHKLKATRKAERNRPGVVQYLVSELEHELTRRLDVEACFLPDRPHIDTLRALVAVQRRHDMVVPIPDDHAMWTSFEPVARMLVGMAKDPLAFNAREWVERGLLVQEANLPDDDDDSRAKFYVRVGTLRNAPAAYLTYMSARIADSPNAVLKLLMLGVELDQIEETLAAAMDSKQQGDAAREFIAEVRRNARVNDLRSRSAISPRTAGTALYGGYGIACTAEQRAKEDREATQRRVCNFTASLTDAISLDTLAAEDDVDFLVYRIPALEFSVDGPLAIRTDPLIGLMEATLIDSCGGISENSARGGFGADGALPPDAQECVDEALEMSGPHDYGTDEDPVLAQNVRAHLNGEVAFFGRQPEFAGTVIAAHTLESALKNAADSIRTIAGEVLVYTVMKDIPAEVFFGQVGGIYDVTTGHGMKELREAIRLLHTGMPKSGDLDIDAIARYCGASVDLWRFILEHGWWKLLVLFTSRLLCLIRALILVTHSNRVAFTVQSRALADVHASFLASHGPIVAAFLSGETLDELRTIFPDLQDEGGKFSGGEYMEIIGVPMLARVGPDSTDIVIHVSAPDGGHIKYTGRFSGRRRELLCLVQAVIAVLSRWVARRLRLGDRVDRTDGAKMKAWLEATIAEANRILAKSGLAQLLDARKRVLGQSERVFFYLAARSAGSTKKSGARAPRRRHCTDSSDFQQEVAAPGRQARLDQIARISHSAAMPGAHDPHHLAPYGKPIGSQAWADWMLSLSDGTNIPRSAQTSGRTHEAHLASKVSHAGIRQWNKALALERQKSEAQEYLTDAVAMLSTSSWWDPTYFSARSKAPPTTEPWMQGSIPMDQTWRYFLCTECDTYLVRGRQQKRHICSAHPDNNKRSTSFSLKKFPDTRRFVYVHDITNSILFDCIDSTSLESLIKLRAADILTANATSVRLPRGDYASVQGFIYVSATDAQDPKELMTAAFDVFIQEKSTCPPEFRAEDATCVNKPWTAEGQDFLKVLAGKSKKTLFLTCCEYGWASVLARDQGNRKWEHTCEFGRDSGRVKAYGPCNTVKTRPVKSFLDLPPNWASRAWFWQRRQGLGDTQVQMWKAD